MIDLTKPVRTRDGRDLSFSEPGDDDMDDDYTDMAIEFNLVNNQESEWDQ